MRFRPLAASVLAAAVSLTTVGVAIVATPAVSSAHRAPRLIYMSLGDSYSVGFQPPSARFAGGATAGYTAVVAKKEHMALANFGCGGATTSSILNAIGCTESGYGPPAAIDAVAYPTETQAQAAVGYIDSHPGQIGLITVSIGGNDVTSCAGDGSVGAILSCVETADSAIATNVGTLVSRLDSALSANGDTTAKVIGLTYPDVILGRDVYPAGSADPSLAALSVTAFDDLINPTLEAAYGGASNFVDITDAPYKAATSGDDSNVDGSGGLTAGTTKRLKPYGVLPSSVWEICTLTYYCSVGNIHANTKGYTWIGKEIVAHLAPAA